MIRTMLKISSLSRRQFTKLGGCAAALPALAAQAPPTSAPEGLRSEFLMDLVLETSPAVAAGTHNITPVTGGTFAGPKVKGKVLGPGGDWTTRRPDGVIILDVRTILQTDDDQRIYVSYRGVIHRLQAPSTVYWRVTPIFETASAKYDWLNDIVAVGVRYDVPGRVAYHIYEIL
jgi:Protein of unknown function (DUF3237)